MVRAVIGRVYRSNLVLSEPLLWLDYDAVEPDVTHYRTCLPPMSFEMKDLREKKEKASKESDAEQSSASVTDRIDNSVTIWAGVAATWSVV